MPAIASKDKQRPTPSTHDCACFNLRKASRAVTQYFDEAFKTTGLGANQLSILFAVATFPEGAGVVSLSDVLVMDRSTLTRNLRPLAREGWLSIVPGQDRRQRIVSLSSTGRDLLQRAYPLWDDAQTRFVAELGPARWREMLTMLRSAVDIARRVRV